MPTPDDALSILERKLAREKAARQEAETLLEQKSLELFNANDGLRRTNEEQQRRALELIDARDKALEAVRAKSEFLANVSHEIRTPMNGVLGFVELLTTTELTSQQREYVEVVRISGETLLNLINDILDFSKIEAGKIELEVTDFDLQQLLDGVADLLAPRAMSKGLELLCSTAGNATRFVRGDPARLRQVLLNLTGNAIKFTEEGEVELRADASVTDDGRVRLRVRVRDTGIGIPSDKRHRLFQAFTQVDGSTTRRYGGTGLGLIISKRLVELMGGTITVESESGVGTTFTVDVPLDRGAELPVEPMLPLDGQRILVVDDNPTNRALIEEMLRPRGCEVRSVGGALEALATLKEAANLGAPYSVALLDLQMPGIDGLGLAHAISAEPAIAATRLVLLSSMFVEKLDVGRTALFASVLMKPVKRDKLSRAIADALRAGDHAPPKAATAVPPRASPPLERRHAIRPIRILLAEDNVVNQKLAVILLTKAGHSVDVVATGRAALEATARESFDLVFMDAQMPDLDGLEATAAIRARERGQPGIPIVAMTARAMKGDREQCLAAGMNDYLMKPIRAEQVEQMVLKWAGRRVGVSPPAPAPTT